MSVVIPAYNAAAHVQAAIESVLAQTLPAAEIIVVDDGSTDVTAATARQFGDAVTVIARANGGAAAARNAGARAASGHWLAFLDADDTWLPTKLERQLQLAAVTKAALVYTNCRYIGETDGLPTFQSETQRLFSGDVFVDLLVVGNHIPMSSVLLDREVFVRCGGFCELPPYGAEDWDLWVRVAERHQVAVSAEPLVCYRIHPGMLSGDAVKMRLARNAVIARALELPRAHTFTPALRRRIWSTTACSNGMDAARHGATWLAIREYARSIALWPFNRHVYPAAVRLLLGRARRPRRRDSVVA